MEIGQLQNQVMIAVFPESKRRNFEIAKQSK